MTVEAPKGEPPKDKQSLLIIPGVAIRPFENDTDFYEYTDEDLALPNFIPETYRHAIILRRKVSFLGLNGLIDVITEDPLATFRSIRPGMIHEQPMDAISSFMFTMSRKTNQLSVDEEPCILRFSFKLRTPSDYSKLLNTHLEAQLEKERYRLFWALQQKKQKRIFKRLEIGRKEIKVTEKNLFNVKMKEFELAGEAVDDEEIELPKLPNEDIGRVSFIWLPMDLNRLKTIAITYYEDGKDGDEEQLPDPIEPEAIKEPVLV